MIQLVNQGAALSHPGVLANLILGRSGNPEVRLHGSSDGRRNKPDGIGSHGPPFFLTLAHVGLRVTNPSRRRLIPSTEPGAEYAGKIFVCEAAEA
jgi:hypothetical protein